MTEINYKQITNNCIIEAAHDQIAVTCSISTAERGGVSKLLGITSECKVYAVEAMNGEARVTGKVCYKVIYSDSEGKPGGLDYFCDFNETLADESITAALRLNATATVVDVSGAIDGNDITLTAVCDFVLRGIIVREGKAAHRCEGIFTKHEQQECVRLSPIKETSFELTAEEESGVAVDKVLFFETSALVTSSEPLEAGVAVNGIAVAEIVYLSDGVIRGKTITTEFSNEIEASAKADVRASVKSSRLVLSGEETNNIFEVELYITLVGYDVDVESVETAVDAFCLENVLNTQVEYLPCKRFTAFYSFNEPISAEADAPDIDEDSRVLASPVSRVNIARVVSGNNQATVEGIAVVNVLYSISDGQVNAAQVELPFSLQLQAQEIREGDYLTAEALANGLIAGFSGGVLKLSAQLCVTVYVYRTYRLRWISFIEEGEKKQQPVAGISVCFADPKETAWEVAKAVNASPEEILALNPSFAEEVTTEERRVVTIFRHRE